LYSYQLIMTKAEKTRQFIIEKAAPIFNMKGIAATAMSDIMEATKLSKGSLYVHFDDKEALSHSAVDYNLNCLLNRVSAEMGKAKTAKEKLIASIVFLGDSVHPPVAGGCPMLNFGLEADDTNPAVLKKVAKAVKSIQQATATLVKQGIAAGEFKKNWDADVFAIKSFALVEGGILLSRVTGKADQMRVIIKIITDEIEEMSS
jgi:TetR/AcrR family transcriptional regulator, transcriptional repressor for nem operon